MPNKNLPTIIIVNTSDDYLDIMRLFLNAEGYVTVPIKITDVKTGEFDIVASIVANNPRGIVYDIAFPYLENWKQFLNISQLDICKDREFILTTPNIDALNEQIGQEIAAHEIVDKEIDLRKIVTHINEVWSKVKNSS